MLVPKAVTVEATTYPPVAPQTTLDLPHFAMIPRKTAVLVSRHLLEVIFIRLGGPSALN
jgi:hypothetical protein